MAGSGIVLSTAICPGTGRFVRSPGYLGGIASNPSLGIKGIPEYQLAQASMFAYFYPYFKAKYPVGSFVLADAAWSTLFTGITKADQLLDVMRGSFRKWYKGKGGLLKPDILGFCAMPSESGRIMIELAEVTTVGEATETLKDDIKRKMESLTDIINGLKPNILDSFSLSSYMVDAKATTWRPTPMQRIIPLPMRQEGNTILVEWICFQPTFDRNPPLGIDGLLLYEIHSMRFKRDFVPQAVLEKFALEEKRRRQAARLNNGLTLTPWLTQQTLAQAPLDRDLVIAFAILAGVGLAVLGGMAVFTVVAGIELAEVAGLLAIGAEAEVSAASISTVANGTAASIEVGAQWSAAAGYPIVAGPAMAIVMP